MKHLNNIFISVALIFTSFVSYGQYEPDYSGGINLTFGDDLLEFIAESPLYVITTDPTSTVNVRSFDEPGTIETITGYQNVLTNDNVIELSRSKPLNLALGPYPGDPNGMLTIKPIVTSASTNTGVNINKLWVGRQESFTSTAYTELKIDTQSDTLIVDEIWIPQGCELHIEGQYPLIVRKELHNKGTIYCDENLYLPVLTGDTAYRALHSMFEQKGTVVGRFMVDNMFGERPEFLNWDWVVESYGADATYVDSLSMLGYDPNIVEAYVALADSLHYSQDYPAWWFSRLDNDLATNFSFAFELKSPTVKGVRPGAQYGDHERIAIFKDAFPRQPWLMKAGVENSLPDDYDLMSEINEEVAVIVVNRNALQYYHNTVLNGIPWPTNDAGELLPYIPNTYTEDQLPENWERVDFIDENQYWRLGYRTNWQYSKVGDSAIINENFWPPAWYLNTDSLMASNPNPPLPWADGDIVPEAELQSLYQGTGVNNYTAFTTYDANVEDIFVAVQYANREDLIIDDTTYVTTELIGANPNLEWLWGTFPQATVDTLYKYRYAGATDTITSIFSLYELASDWDGVYFPYFRLVNSPAANPPLWDWATMLEQDTTVAGYDSVFDYKWFYRDEAVANNSVWNGWNTIYAREQASSWWSSYTDGFRAEYATMGNNANQMWEHPQKMYPADTLGRHFPGLFDWDQDVTFNLDSLDGLGPYPTVEELYEDYPLLNQYNPYYPEGTRMKPVRRDPGSEYWGSAWLSPDHSVPMPFPIDMQSFTNRTASTETIDRFTGYAWMNTLDAYDHPNMAFHPQPYSSDIAIPNLPPNNSGDHSITFAMPTAYDWVYTYAPNGLLYEYQTWSSCLETTPDTIFSNPDVNGIPQDTLLQIQACINYFDDESNQYTEYDICTEPTLASLLNEINYDENVIEDYSVFGNPYARRNRWQSVTNPLHGYLDLDQVADKYFEDYPDANHLEFAWWNSTEAIGTENQNAGNIYNAKRSYWRRKYHRYGDNIVSDEVEYFLSLLADQFIAQGGQGFNAELTNVILSFLSGEGVEPGTPVFNWLVNAAVNPNGYVGLGQYAMPGTAFYAKNTSGNDATITVTADMGIYDFEFPFTTEGEVYVGSAGPGWDGTGYGEGFGGRSANSVTTAEFDHSTILALDYYNDSTYMPWIFLHHRFMDDASNGSDQIHEDNQASLPHYPFVFTDSSNVRASNYLEEYGPHNQQPLYINIPQPLDSSGAFCIIPACFQNTGSQWYDAEQAQIYTRLGVELYDGNGDITQILYLDQMDTLWVRHSDDYDWPIKGKIYFTNMYGDVNGDGLVGIGDFLAMFAAFNQCGDDYPNLAYFDLNGDGCVTTSDYLFILANFGTSIGNEIGEFSDNPFVNSGPERGYHMSMHPDWPTADITAGFLELPNIRDVATLSGRKLTLFGEDIQVFSTDLKEVVTGRNQVSLPATGGPFLILADNTIGYYDPTDPDPGKPGVAASHPTIDDRDGGKTAMLPALAAAYPTGSAQFWVDFYTDFKTVDNLYDGNLQHSPTIAQVYYGITSGDSPLLLDRENATIDGLIDMFGAGDTEFAGYKLGTAKGAASANRWTVTAKAYTNFTVDNNQPLFEPTFVPLAFAMPRAKTEYHLNREIKFFETNPELDRVYHEGLVDNFDNFSELSGKREPGVLEWGGDIKKYYDTEFQDGILAMCDFMTLKDYFEFKMYGVSPKFGLINTGSTLPRTEEESFGTPYETGAAEGVANDYGVGFAPMQVGDLDDYTQIITAFITPRIGDPVVLPQDVAPPTADGVERNVATDHYAYFTNSAAFTYMTSYGPILYDFNMNSTWDAEDLTIWNGLVARWRADGITEHQVPMVSASYYRPATDALNQVVNVIQDYDPDGSYHSSVNFNKWFNADVTADPFDYVTNWHKCLNQGKWNLNLLPTQEITTSAFMGTTDADDSFLYNTERTGFNPDLLTPTTLNNYGKVAVGDYATNIQRRTYNAVPSTNYFPVTKYWHP